MASNNIHGKEQVEEITKVWANLEKVITENVDILQKYGKTASSLPSDYVKQIEATRKAQEGLNEAIKEAKKRQKDYTDIIKAEERQVKKTAKVKADLAISTSKEAKEYHKLNEEKKLSDKLNRDEAKHDAKKIIANKKLASSWAELNIKLDVAEKKYRELAVTLGKGNKQTKIAQREVLKLRNQIDGINKPIKRWNSNVGNYASGLRNIAGALGWAGVTFAMVNGIKATYETIKAYDALLKSLDKVTISQQEAAAQFGFVMDISERFGLSLRDTTKDYVRFLAAVKGTTLEGKKAKDIFESVSKSAASMGLSAEETSGTLRALNQIISKGKVQAEELRGQLGDRIPGALQIMARSLGVTTSELDQMLKKGEVIADEVLPAFAKEMERTFGVENVNRIDTLVAAQNRLSTAWDRLIISIENGDGVISKFLKTTFNLWASQLTTIKALIVGFDGVLENNSISSYQETIDKLNQSQLENISISKNMFNNNNRLLKQKEQELINLKNFAPANKGERLNKEKDIKNTEIEISLLKGKNDAFLDYIKSLTEKKNSLIDKIILTDKSIKQGDLEKKSIKELTSLYNLLNKSKGGGVKDEISRPKNLSSISDLSAEAGTEEAGLIKTKKAVDDKIKSIKELLEYIPKWTKEYKDLEKQLLALEGYLDFDLAAAGKDALDEWSKDFKEQQKELYEIQKEYTQKREDLERNLSSNLKELGLSVADALFQTELNKLDDLARVNEEKANEALDFANGNAAAEERIREQSAERQGEIEEERIKTDKKAFLLNQAFKAGEIAIETIKSVSELKGRLAILKAQAAINPLFAPLVPVVAAQIPLVISAGAIAGAAVLAQSVPAFWTGTESTPAGEIMVNDDPYGIKGNNYKEVIKEPSGKLHFPQGKNVKMNVPQGSTVFPNYDMFNADLDNILNSSGIIPFNSQLEQQTPIISVNNTGATASEIDSVMGKYFSNLQVNQTIIDKNGIRTLISKGNSKTVIHNNRVSGKGFSV